MAMKSSESKPRAKRSQATTAHARHAHTGKPKVFDVVRPGKTRALPSSRPIIVGHKPEVQKSQAAVSGIGESQVAPSKKKIEIKPLHKIELEPTSAVVAAASQSMIDPEDVPAGAPSDAALSASITPDLESPAVLPLPKGEPAEAESDALPAAESPKGPSGPPPLPQDDSDQPVAPTLGSLQASAKLTPPEPESANNTPAEATPEKPTPAVPEPPVAPPVSPSLIAKWPTPPTSVDAAKPADPSAQATPAASSQGAKQPAPKASTTTAEIDPNDIQDIVVSHHKAERNWLAVLLLLLILLLAVVALNVILDAEVINIPGFPRTDYL